MKILLLNGYAVCARTSEEELKAYLYLFKKMNREGFYDDLNNTQYVAAKNGNAIAAKALLQYRSNHRYEYEIIETLEAIEP